MPWYSGCSRPKEARQGADRVVGSCAAVVEVDAEERELLLQGPDADAEHEASTRHRVERAVALHDLERMVVPEDEDERDEADGGGARGEVAEHCERVPIGAAAALGDLRRDGDVLAARHVVVPETFRFEHDALDLGDPCVGLPPRVRTRQAGDDGRDEPELHFVKMRLSTLVVTVRDASGAATCGGAGRGRR